jgi:ABC-type multidrug transport system ATPase subunit
MVDTIIRSDNMPAMPSPSTDLTVHATGLRKQLGTTNALDSLDVTMVRGRVLAVLGPNGAGKTTFVRTIATLLRPDDGSLIVAGHDVIGSPHLVRRAIGFAGQYAAVEPAMTGRENLRMVARLFGHGRNDASRAADHVLDQLGLLDDGDRLVREYSGGMRRRLDLGASLVGAPRLLLLDEPTTGLDPRSRLELWAAIEVLVAAGTDVLLTTQYLEEADRLAHDIVIIDHGRTVATGTPSELKRRAGTDVIELHLSSGSDIHFAAAHLAGALSITGQLRPSAANRLSLPAHHGVNDLVATIRALDDIDVRIDDISLRRPTLDDVFIALTGAPTTTHEEAA